MEYVKLGRSGLEVSRICLGCLSYGQSPESRDRWPWTLSEEESRPFIKKAIESGINFFDTANVYSDGESERVLGRAIKDYARRDEVVLATKVFSPTHSGPNARGLSRKTILSEIDKSLERLGTNHVDLLIVHRFDDSTPLEETLETLDGLVHSGKVRYLGASSMHAWQFMKAIDLQRVNNWSPFISMQNYYNLLYREEEREMLPLCRSEGIGVTPWSPLARGKLARPWSESPQTVREKNDPFAARTVRPCDADIDKPVVDRLIEVANGYGVRPAQIALAWMLRAASVVAPVIGATKPDHLTDAVDSLSVTLSDRDAASLEELYRPHASTDTFK